MCLISHWQSLHDPGHGNPACLSLSRTSVAGCSPPHHSDTPQSHYSPFCFSLLGFKPCVAWYGQCTDEITPCSSKPLLPNWFATVGWFCPSWVPVVSVFHCFGLFNAFLLRAYFWEKQQVQEWACREAVEGLELGICNQGGFRKRTEQEWPGASLLLQGFILHLVAPPWGILGTGVITFPPGSSQFLPTMDAEDFKNLKGSGQLCTEEGCPSEQLSTHQGQGWQITSTTPNPFSRGMPQGLPKAKGAEKTLALGHPPCKGRLVSKTYKSTKTPKSPTNQPKKTYPGLP